MSQGLRQGWKELDSKTMGPRQSLVPVVEAHTAHDGGGGQWLQAIEGSSAISHPTLSPAGPGRGPPDVEAWELRGGLQSVQQELAQCTEQRDQAVAKVSMGESRGKMG